MHGESSTYPRTVITSVKDARTNATQNEEDLEFISLRSMEFNRNEAIYSLMKPNNTNYLVVGVIGGPGVGKSSILNTLLDQSTLPPFRVGTLDSISKCRHTTSSIDIRVNDLRLIGLDSQPMCSPSVLLQLLTNVSPCMELARGLSVAALQGARPSQASAEALYRILSIQVTSFMLCCCHVVLVVMDGSTDHQILNLWKISELFAVMIRASLSDCRLEDNKEMELAQVLLIGANWPLEDLSSQIMEFHKNHLEKITSFSKLINRTSNLDSMHFLAPFGVSGNDQEGTSLSEKFNNETLGRLRSQLMTLKENRVQDLTETEWLKRCQAVWDAIWKSKEIGEHFFELQDTLYKGGVGL